MFYQVVITWASYGISLTILTSICLLALLWLYLLPPKRQKPQMHPHHVVITGGSSGIGLAMAQECISLMYPDHKPVFSTITVIARNKVKLDGASKILEALSADNQCKINTISADVTSWESISKVAEELSKRHPPVDILFNNAGSAVASSFQDADIHAFEDLMKVNYLGSVYTTRAFLPSLLKAAAPTIVFTSSAAGQVGVFGYSAYSPTKFALRGFAEVLSMELQPRGVQVQIAFPPDTDTPGYHQENVGKPKETMLISEEAGLWTAEDVAKTMVSSALNPTRFQVYFGLEGWMLSTLTAGMSTPARGFLDAMSQICLMGLLRLVSLFYCKSFRDTIDRCYKEKIDNEAKNK